MIETGFVLGIVVSVFLAEVCWGRRVGLVRSWLWGRRVPLLNVRSLLMIGAAVIVAGAASAPAASPPSAYNAEGEVVIALDVSRSMTVRDGRPDRLTLAQTEAMRVLAALPGTRVGLVAFADEAQLLVPPTVDHTLITTYLQAIDPEAVTAQGSDLADAIAVSLNALSVEDVRHGGVTERALVVVSDAESFEDPDRLNEVVREAGSRSVPIHWLTVGSSEGGTVPGAGAQAISRADMAKAERIAEATNGRAVRAGERGGLATILAELAAAPPTSELAPLGPAPEPPPVSWLALVAFVAVGLEWLIGLRPWRLS